MQDSLSLPRRWLFGATHIANALLRDYRYGRKGMPQTESTDTYGEGYGTG